MTPTSPSIQDPRLIQAKLAQQLIDTSGISAEENAQLSRALLMIVARMRVLEENMEEEFSLLQQVFAKYQRLHQELTQLTSHS